MAIQAQIHANNFINRSMRDDSLEPNNVYHQRLMNNNQSDPQSELTYIAYGTRKRCRENSVPFSGQKIQPVVSTSTSTSGRCFAPSPLPLGQDLVGHLYQQNLEIEAVVRAHGERLRLGLQETRKRHCRALLSIVEQQTAKRLEEKEINLQQLLRRNADLEEKIRQVAGEKEVWMSIAKNNEAIVAGLRSTLEQLLIQNAVGGGGPAIAAGEDCDDVAPVFSAEDAESCCYEPAVGGVDRPVEAANRRACRACGSGDVSVLVLPCRHLCLCRDCESRVDACPVCKASKNASLQVFMA